VKAIQPPLFLVARSDSAFTRETLRRGGPREVMGVRFRGLKAARMAHEAAGSVERAAMPPGVLAAIGWRKKGL